MYKIIRTGPELHRIGRFALENDKNMAVPPAVLMDALRLLMKNNVFQFGDNYWFQKLGAAMGAPPAPPWATIFFGTHREAVLAQFGDMLQLYCHFINDVLGIWLVNPDPAKDHQKRTEFQLLMQDYYDLELIFKECLKKVNFMDMKI